MLPLGFSGGTTDQRRFARVNRAACRMTGYTETQLLKMSIADLDAAADDWHTETRASGLRPDQARTMESRHRHRDGHIYPVELAASVMAPVMSQL